MITQNQTYHFDLTGFLNRLKQEGFFIGIDTHLSVQKIMAVLPSDSDKAEVSALLMPLLCKSPKQQVTFKVVFQQFWRENLTVTRPVPPVEGSSIPTQPITPKSKNPLNQWLQNLQIWLKKYTEQFTNWLNKNREQKTVAEKKHGIAPDKYRDLFAEAPPVTMPEVLTKAVARLRTREPLGIRKLDIEKTIEKSIKNIGTFTPVYTNYTRYTEYLILIQADNPDDHKARLYNSFFEEMQYRNIPVVRYYFRSNPLVCYDEHHSEGIELTDLLRQQSNAVLIVFAQLHTFLSPRNDEPFKWVHELARLPFRCLFLPFNSELEAHLSRRLGEIFDCVLPATDIGVEQLETYLQNPDKSISLHQFATTQNTFPIQIDSEEDIRQLRTLLPPHLLKWIAACAIYPDFSWKMTLFLGEALSTDMQVYNTWENIRQLARVSCFKEAYMPQYVRRYILEKTENIDWISQDDIQLVRQSILQQMHHNNQAANLKGISTDFLSRIYLEPENEQEKAALATHLEEEVDYTTATLINNDRFKDVLLFDLLPELVRIKTDHKVPVRMEGKDSPTNLQVNKYAYKILVVKSDTSDAELIESLLKEANMKVSEILAERTLAGAIKTLHESDFDVVLLGFNLLDSEGFETLEKLREAHPTTNIIIFTDEENISFSIYALQIGVKDYLVKGNFRSDFLVKTIENVVERDRRSPQSHKKKENKSAKGISVFISYVDEDKYYSDEISKYLRELVKDNTIFSLITDIPNSENYIVEDNFNRIDIVIFLLSAYYLASNYTWERRIKPILDLNEKGITTIIPVIVRQCDWFGSPLGHIQIFPKNGTSLSDYSESSLDRQLGLFTEKVRRIAENIERNETHKKQKPDNLKDVDELLKLIDTDIDAAFEVLSDIFGDSNNIYNDLNEKYHLPKPEIFSMTYYRIRLERFVTENRTLIQTTISSTNDDSTEKSVKKYQFEEIKMLVVNNKISEAIEALLYYTDDTELENEVISIKAMLKNYEERIRNNTLGVEQRNIGYARIANAVLVITDKAKYLQNRYEVDWINKVKNAIAKDEIQDAIQLTIIASRDREGIYENDLILLSGRYQALRQEDFEGLARPNNYQERLNDIINNLIKILSKIGRETRKHIARKRNVKIEQIDKIKYAIARNNLSEAFYLSMNFSQSKGLKLEYKLLTALNDRYRKIITDNNMFSINYETSEKKLDKIRLSLLEILSKIEQKVKN